MNLQQLTNEVNRLYYNNGNSYRTIQSIQSELLELFKPTRSIKKLGRQDILSYIAKLKAQGNKQTTINNKLMYLSKCLSYAYKNKLIEAKPFIPTFKVTHSKIRTITKQEFNTMLSYAKHNNLEQLYQVLMIGYYTGMRIANILALKPEDIDHGYIRVWNNKTNNPYSIPINNKLKDILSNFEGFTMNYRQVQYQFHTMVTELGLQDITIHTLRHTTCTNLVEQGVALPVVQRLMNHKNINTTMIYTHLKNKQLEQAVNML